MIDLTLLIKNKNKERNMYNEGCIEKGELLHWVNQYAVEERDKDHVIIHIGYNNQTKHK